MLSLLVAAPPSWYSPARIPLSTHRPWRAAVEMRHLLLRPDDPEVLTLRDALMAKSVEAQLERFQYMNERGHGMWLSQAWEAHAKDAPPGGGAAFLDALTRTESIEAYFVPTIARRQGSPNNPYLNRAASGYHTTIDPRDLARRLMACRSQLAGEWCEQLRILATGEPHERLAEEALLLGLSARAAMRSLLRGLKPLPSRRGMHAFLEAFAKEHSRDLSPAGEPEAAFAALEALPLAIAGEALIDPPLLCAELRNKTHAASADLAGLLGGTEEEHTRVHASYLETCLRETIDAPSWDRELKKRDQQRQLEASWRVLLRRTGPPPTGPAEGGAAPGRHADTRPILPPSPDGDAGPPPGSSPAP
ncbi:hypothetical protein EMIHUDRAFT_444474 [Emiliania huxleyi CCMP1516]|uniref:Uncharacterized protein n=2 Tax=Emiliania huxleyi TaxID=2903 RepID=A0A0D3JD25_EMIH1|nr:hypothetical protein EMIHUDRAFT_444474 [Emiliania huxleyi CCMP1516]EOD21410.1 hypothetical protein EMIHUDRAFT_444474 [Emiliania huxleyi CCMP1516]|eukprot:XP_005773839.1 hypothetical protein EMIHUDRAFT_444474 [Emiliania huxleyi CCMP1516]